MIVGIPLYAKTFMLSNVNGNTNYTLHMPSELNVGGDAGPSTAAAGTLAYYEVSILDRDYSSDTTKYITILLIPNSFPDLL